MTEYLKTALISYWAFQQAGVDVEQFDVTDIHFKRKEDGAWNVITTYAIMDIGQGEAEAAKQMQNIKNGMKLYDSVVVKENADILNTFSLERLMKALSEGKSNLVRFITESKLEADAAAATKH